MKIPRFTLPAFTRPKKKLRASTSRRFSAEEMDYEEMSEPNMKLSRALLIVLVLHIVAVAGIIAFNAIKSRQGAFPPLSNAPKSSESAPAKVDSTASSAIESKAATSNSARESEPVVPRALPVSVSESGISYVVVKGDNPVKIAKKFKISEFELLAVNHIDDPRKLQIGQKLVIPVKKKGKKD